MIEDFERWLNNKNEIFFFVEKFNKKEKYVLVDFIDSIEFEFFNTFLTFSYNSMKNPTMIEFINYYQKPLREGSIYSLSKEILVQLLKLIVIVEDSFVIGFRFDVLAFTDKIFGKSKSFTESERFERGMDDFTNIASKYSVGKLGTPKKVIIRNIGQGSWNEVKGSDNKVYLLFDIGTIYSTKRVDLLRLVAGRDTTYQNDKPILILSHWDVDHYHFLLAIDDNTISSFTAFMYRSNIPNYTARKALGRFRLLNRNAMVAIPNLSPKPKKSGKKLSPVNISKGKGHILFNSQKNTSRNKSGLGLVIRTRKSSIIFSGDFDYSQVSNDMLPSLNYNSYHYLIVPHHGGNAGKFIYKCGTKIKLAESIISVGRNPYHPPHPHLKNINSLGKIGFTVVRTDRKTNDHTVFL